MPVSTNWRFCTRCNAIFNSNGDCRHKNNRTRKRYHTNRYRVSIRMKEYALFYNINPYSQQPDPSIRSEGNWWECEKCGVLIYFNPSIGNVEGNRCFAGGQHQRIENREYFLKHDPHSLEEWEEVWYWCNKCQSLHKGGGSCPSRATQKHTSRGSSRWIVEEQRPYQKSFFVTSHNSYESHLSIPEQLDVGVR